MNFWETGESFVVFNAGPRLPIACFITKIFAIKFQSSQNTVKVFVPIFWNG